MSSQKKKRKAGHDVRPVVCEKIPCYKVTLSTRLPGMPLPPKA